MGVGRVGLGEADALGRQTVGIGRVTRMAGQNDIAALLIGHEDENVGTLGIVFLSGLYGLLFQSRLK